MKKILALLTTALLAGSVVAGEFPDISVKDLKAAIEAKKVILLDANGTSTWKKHHVPTAIDFAANKEKLAKLLPQDKDALIVAYCGNSKCTAYQAAAKEAQKLGYRNIKHLSAGIAGWIEAGEKTEKGN